MKINCKYEKLIPIEAVIDNEKNPNTHPKRQIEMLAKMMKYQGWRHPIIISKLSGKCVAGHGRKAAALLNGWSEVPVDMQDFDDAAQEMSFLASDNLIAELAETNQEMLLDLGLTLGMDFDQELLGLDIDLFKTELPEVIEHEGLDNLKITIRECPHCKESFEESTAKIIG